MFVMYLLVALTNLVLVCVAAVTQPASRLDAMSVLSLVNEEQCRRLCWYRPLCTGYSFSTKLRADNCVLHSEHVQGGAPLDPNTLPADWRAHGASGDRILNTCASRTCGHTEVCVPRTPTPGQHDCLAVPARCQDPAINNTVLQLLSGSLQDDVANVTCDASFVASPRHVSTQIQCQVTGRWTTWSGQCLQAEFHPTGQAATDFKERVPWTITVGSRVCVEATYGGPSTMEVNFLSSSGANKLHVSFQYYGSDRIIWDYHNAQGGWPGPKDLGRVQFVSGEQLKIEFYMESPVLMVMQLTRTALGDIRYYPIPLDDLDLSVVYDLQARGNAMYTFVSLVSGCT